MVKEEIQIKMKDQIGCSTKGETAPKKWGLMVPGCNPAQKINSEENWRVSPDIFPTNLVNMDTS